MCILMPSNNQSSIEIILTVRSKKLKTHSGQISFPGGKLDKSDNNLIECALRETYEEIGIEKTKEIILSSNLSLVFLEKREINK